jgi:hypothetical protein
VLGADVSDSKSLNLWSTEGVRSLLTSPSLVSAVVNDNATWVAYETRSDFIDASGGHASNTDLRVLELGTGRDVFVYRSRSATSQPSISNDGRLLLYVSDNSATQPAQAWLALLDGLAPVSKQLTSVPEGISEAVLTGNGR